MYRLPVGVMRILLVIVAVACCGNAGLSANAASLRSAADASAPARVSVPVPIAPQAPQIPGARFSVKTFGAIPDDGIDDTATIQTAINAVSATGGGHLVFPAGTFDVSIADRTSLIALSLASRVSIEAEVRGRSRIRLADHQGNYVAMFAGGLNGPVDDTAFNGLVIDMNSAANPVGSWDDVINSRGLARFAIRLFHGHRIAIDHNRFTNVLDVNIISLNGAVPGGSRVGDGSLTHNVFDKVGGGPVDFDHSSIYTHGPRFLIAHNRFLSTNGAGTFSAHTAIEVHGDDQYVHHNIMDGFMIGIAVTGVSYSSERLLVTHNVIRGVGRGLMIWSYFYGGNTTEPGLQDVMIAHNDIRIDADAWTTSALASIQYISGISLAGASTAPIVNLHIVHNRIALTNARYTSKEYPTRYWETGITLWQYGTPGVTLNGIHVDHNVILGSLNAGIYSDAPVVGPLQSTINNNYISSPNRNPSGTPANSAAGVYVGGRAAHLQVSRNVVVDNGRPLNTEYGASLVAECASDCRGFDNHTPRSIRTQLLGSGWTE